MRILMSEAYIHLDNTAYRVKMYEPKMKLREGEAYLKVNGLVYPYRGKYSEILCDKPGIYKGEAGEHICIPIPKKLWEEYSEEKIQELNIRKIVETIQKNPEDFADQETVEEALSGGDLLRPVIKSEDDFLKYLIKQIIIRKGVSASVYKKKFAKSHEFPNLKQSLDRDTKMTVVNFRRWADLLGFKWKITVEDPNDPELYKDISVSSED